MCSVVVSTGWCEMTAMLLSLSHSHFLWYAQLVEIPSCGYGHELSAGKWEINGCKRLFIYCARKKKYETASHRYRCWDIVMQSICSLSVKVASAFFVFLLYTYICRSCPTMPALREKCHAEYSGIGIVHNVLTGCSAAGHVKPFHAVSKAVLKLEQTDHTNGQPMLISPPHWEL